MPIKDPYSLGSLGGSEDTGKVITNRTGASLVAQWWAAHLSMQETRVRSLVLEDVSEKLSSCATTTEAVLQSPGTTLLSPLLPLPKLLRPSVCAPREETPLQRGKRTRLPKRSPALAAASRKRAQQRRPSTTKVSKWTSVSSRSFKIYIRDRYIYKTIEEKARGGGK